jgi:hypothetical protein
MRDALDDPELNAALTPPPRRRWPLVILLVLLGITGLGLLAQQSGVLQRVLPSRERLLVRMACNGEAAFFTLRADGSELTGLPALRADAVTPAPDGSALAYLRGGRLHVLEQSGRDRTYDSYHGIADLTFSRDGQTLAFVAEQEGKPVIIVLATDGHGAVREIRGLGAVGHPALNANGTRLLYEDEVDGVTAVIQADSDGAHRAVLASHGLAPRYSPDGRTLVYYLPGTKLNYGQLYLSDVQGGHLRRLCPLRKWSRDAVFSHDGTRVLFQAGNAFNGSDAGLYQSTIDGAALRQITPANAGPLTYDFSPDGTAMAFADDGGVYRVDDSGHAVRLLSAGGALLGWHKLPRAVLAPAKAARKPWQPDGYVVTGELAADVDGDARPETVYTLAPLESFTHRQHSDASKYVVVARDGVVVKSFALPGADAIVRLAAIDLTGDMVPELLFATESRGASDTITRVYAYLWQATGFVSLFARHEEECLIHAASGGVLVLPGSPATLVSYDAVWGDGEARIDPHRYAVDEYRWSRGALRRAAHRTTAQSYVDPLRSLAEFRLVPPADPTLRF